MTAGEQRWTGTPAELRELAAGQLWRSAERAPGALLSWRTAEGRHRNLGTPPAGAEIVEPTVEDGYLLLLEADEPRVRCAAMAGHCPPIEQEED